MLPEDKQAKIQHVQDLIDDIPAVALATVSSNGTPHNTPVFAVFDHEYNVVWTSDPSSQHSQNIARTNKVFVVTFDATCKQGSGLYIEAEAEVIEPEHAEFAAVYKTFARAQQDFGAPKPLEQDFAQPDGQRLYRATPKTMWINYTTKNERGVVVRDQRFRVTAAMLDEA
jgi:predicted pyridoxine 5'-phosphate oxidase superfamily flavin-nucleotide-binding protein